MTRPHDILAEQSLLGALLIDPRRFSEVDTVVSGVSFYRPAHETIYNAMKAILESGESLDIVSLNSLLTRNQTLESVGGLHYLMTIADFVPTAANVMTYAEIVRREYSKSVILQTACNAADALTKGETDTDAVVSKILDGIDLATHRGNLSEHVDDLLGTEVEEIAARTGVSQSGVRTGLANIDQLTNGFKVGEFSIIGARPSMGKSALALQIAHTAALRNECVLYISIEMSRSMVAHRLLSLTTGIDGSRISNDMLDADEINKIRRAKQLMSKIPLYIGSQSPCDISMIKAMCTKHKRMSNLRMVVIDYLQMIEVKGNSESRTREVGVISRSLKALSKELGIAVVALSSLSRRVEQRDDKRPIMSDLRESGDIESDADLVSFLYRPLYYADPSQREGLLEEECEFIVSKNRNGRIGTAKLTFFNTKATFSEAYDMGGF